MSHHDLARRLPAPETETLQLGFMRLTDSAPLILAQEAGLFHDFGLDVHLVREVSWANLRDKLAIGQLDAAQLLAPLPFSAALGVGGIRAELLTGLSLSLNGNALTLSTLLWEQLAIPQRAQLPDAIAAARALAQHIRTHKTVPVLATVHLFSMHTFLLRLWLQAGGIDPDHDIRLIVLPPEQMCDSLARGNIDGFCVGEPWSSVAVAQGIGTVVSSGYQIWNNAPEKVLAVSSSWHQQHPVTHLRLRLAIMIAARKLLDVEQRLAMAEIMAHAKYLDLPARTLLPSLSGHYRFHKTGKPVAVPDFHVFASYQAGFPWRSHAEWMIKQIGQLSGKPVSAELSASLSRQAYRTDLYREAAAYLEEAAPAVDYKVENTHTHAWNPTKDIRLGANRMISNGA
ncbi:MAG: CmpA/NrtA family ABC transporter substrate-binding protein [Pseudomonadales bacterium]|nr:CmpA/NrtA family ABC transporter substrate-binding protein [Pseudomonadales bacterium]